MKQLNLLPKAVRQRAMQHRVVPVLAVAALVALAGVGLGWLVLSQQVKSLQSTLADRQAAEEQKVAQDAKNQQGLLPSADLTNRISQINTLSQTETSWSKFFALVASITPKDIYLSNYSLATLQGNTILKLSGEAPSNVSFASFTETLATLPSVKNPKVETYQYAAGKGTVTFVISAQVPAEKIGYSTP